MNGIVGYICTVTVVKKARKRGTGPFARLYRMLETNSFTKLLKKLGTYTQSTVAIR